MNYDWSLLKSKSQSHPLWSLWIDTIMQFYIVLYCTRTIVICVFYFPLKNVYSTHYVSYVSCTVHIVIHSKYMYATTNNSHILDLQFRHGRYLSCKANFEPLSEWRLQNGEKMGRYPLPISFPKFHTEKWEWNWYWKCNWDSSFGSLVPWNVNKLDLEMDLDDWWTAWNGRQ